MSQINTKVSVAMLTYNHEEFLAKAIDSILMQRTNFNYEVVIGEDFSTDNTRNIVIAYQKEYPGKFRLLLNDKNIGMHANCAQTLRACKGEYIAILEGDDYWTSADKLQKQVNFLDAHPECAICFHNVTEVYKDGSRESHHFVPPDRKEFEFYTVEDLLKGNFIPTPATMFRNGLAQIPDWFSALPMGDWPLHILNALHGKIGYINEVMAVHLNHRGGAWFAMHQNMLEAQKASIVVYDHLHIHLDEKYRPVVARILHELCLKIAGEYEESGDSVNAKRYSIMAFSRHFLTSMELYKILLRLYAPMFYKVVKNLKTACLNMKKAS